MYTSGASVLGNILLICFLAIYHGSSQKKICFMYILSRFVYLFFIHPCSFDQLRTEVNRVLEVARTEKLIGSSLEAKVFLHTSDASLASRLSEMSAANHEADTLHRIFITSQVRYSSLFTRRLSLYELLNFQ